MAVFKTSNHYPSLTEIDIHKVEDTLFTAQVNTSGEPIKAYKFTILSEDSSDTIYESPIVALDKPVKNKQQLNIPINMAFVGTTYYSDATLTTSVGTLSSNVVFTYVDDTYSTIKLIDTTYYIATPEWFLSSSFNNGKNYQWAVRVYNVLPNSTTQPNTLVCEGYLTGSTKSVIWTRISDHGETGVNKAIAENIVYDRYIEFSVASADELIIGAHEPDEKTKPTNYPYIQRKKIDWVTKELGTDKDFIKIETSEAFDYDYYDGKTFTIYQCSSDHTIKSLFADPNSNVNSSHFIIVYKTLQNAKDARTAKETPGDIKDITRWAPCMERTDGIAGYAGRKIIGYSSDTGEMRFNDTFKCSPVNGQYYRLFKYDSLQNTYTAVDDTVSGSVDPLVSHIVGGTPIANNTYYKTISNKWDLSDYVISGSRYYSSNTLDESTYVGTLTTNRYLAQYTEGDAYCSFKVLMPIGPGTSEWVTYYSAASNFRYKVRRLFIQPNINIKTDETNPNEIVFSAGRVDIRKQTSVNPTTRKTIDTTFNKLDNTQWLLEGNSIVAEEVIPIDIIPQTDYKVYTDFMDSMPYNLFYARSTPSLTLQCRNYYQTNLSTISSSSFDFDEAYYLPSGTHYYPRSNQTGYVSGDKDVYIQTGTKYYSDQSLTQYVGKTNIPYPDGEYVSDTCASFTKENSGGIMTIYYVRMPDDILNTNIGCNWSVNNEYVDFEIAEVPGRTFYANNSSIRQNPVKYTNMPSVVYKQAVVSTIAEVGTLYYATPDVSARPEGMLILPTEYTYLNPTYSRVWVNSIEKYIKTPIIDFSQYYDYRDIQFNTQIVFDSTETQQQVKYYKYLLYALSNSNKDNSSIKTLIAESEEIYSIDVEWYFRGFERGSNVATPKQYEIEVVVTDMNDKQFSTSQQFGIYYPVEKGVVPLSLTYDCHEKGININIRNPLYVKSTDLDTYISVDSTDFVKGSNGEISHLHINEDKVLNYTNIDNEDELPIYIPVVNSMLTQFQLTGDFIENISPTAESNVLKLANEFTQEEFDQIVSNSKVNFDSQYNNNIKYDDLDSMPIYKPITPSVTYPASSLVIPYYFVRLVASEGTNIFVPYNSTSPLQYYSDTACTQLVGTVTTDVTVIYTTSYYSQFVVGTTAYYVKNETLTNMVIYVNAISSSGTTVSVLSESDCQTYVDGLISSATTKTASGIALVDDSTSKRVCYIKELNSFTRFNTETEEWFKKELRSFGDEMAYLIQNYSEKGAYVEDYLLTMSNINSYYYDEIEQKYIANNNIANLHMYKNGNMFEPLSCFKIDNTMYDAYNMGFNLGSEYISNRQLRYMLQNTSGFKFIPIGEKLPIIPATEEMNLAFVLQTAFIRDGVRYDPGIYNYSINKGWVIDVNNEYVVVTKDSDLPEEYRGLPEGFTNAVGVYNSETGTYYWAQFTESNNNEAPSTEIVNVWVENTNANIQYNKNAYDKLWLNLFMQMDYFASNPKDKVVCIITKGSKI